MSAKWSSTRSANASSLMLPATRSTTRLRVAVTRVFDRVEQGGVGIGVVEWLAGGVDQRDAALRKQEADGPVAAVERLGDEATDRDVLVRRRAHQRDLRVVNVQPTVAELGRDRWRSDRS